MQSFVSPFRPVDNEMNRPNPQLVRMKKWMRKSTINFLERNKDVIAAPGFVPLCNKMIVDVMATGFEVVARDTHFITCTYPSRPRNTSAHTCQRTVSLW